MQILDSRGNPTVEAQVYLEDNTSGRAAAPSGASTGAREALELRDEDYQKYNGKGVLKAVENINSKISNALRGLNIEDQFLIDQTMIDLDGTENKSNLGANAILAVSLACSHAACACLKIPLFQYISKLSGKKEDFLLPLPMINIINGGKHANWAMDLQEYMIFPSGAETFSQAVQISSEIFHTLAKVLDKKGYCTSVGDEGGYAPLVKNGNSEAFELIAEAVFKAGYKLGEDVVFGLDAAASEFYKDGKYHLKNEGKVLSTDEMIDWLAQLSRKFPIVSMEDCLDQDDWEGWRKLTEKLGEKIQIVGDDLFVTNTKFLQKGIDIGAANAILIKPNQIGTLTETIKTVAMAQSASWGTVISHRSGETEDTTIADLAVGLSSGQIKTGSMSRTERVAKYNQLLRIEKELGNKALYIGGGILKKNG